MSVYTKGMGDRPQIGSKVDYGFGTGEVIVNVIDSSGCIIILDDKCNEYVTVDLNVVRPIPKIEDELVDFFEDTFSSCVYSIEGNKFLVKELLTKYKITKKEDK